MVPGPFAPRGRNRAAPQAKGTTMTKERFDVHLHIIDTIVSAIELDDETCDVVKLAWVRFEY
jgi:hypothetical protein